MNENDETRILDMIDAAEKARNFISGRTRKDLDHDEMLAFAVVRAIAIIGEAASRVSQATQTSLNHIPWTHIVGMRHRIVHDYLNVDYDIVWDVVTVDLPSLIGELKKIVLSDEDTHEDRSE